MKKEIQMIGVLLCTASVGMAQSDSLIESGDTTRIQMKKMEILIITKGDMNCEEGFALSIGDKDSTESEDNEPTKEDFTRWAGVELYVNSYTIPNLPESEAAITVPSLQRSLGVNVNVIERELRLIKNNLLLSTGCGFQFNHYSYDRDTTSIFANPPTFQYYENSSLSDGDKKQNINLTYITVPLFLNFNVNGIDSEKGLHLSAGVIGAWNIRSKNKHKYIYQGDKIKNSMGFHDVAPFKLNAVARAGYGNFVLFASYGITSMNKFNSGALGEPIEGLHTLEAGIQLVGF